MSRSHPDTFIVGFNEKLGQNLRWDEKAQTLTAYVTYSLINGFGDSEWDPSDYRTFKLPFPSVTLDQENNLTVLDGKKKSVVLGHLESSLVGPKVVLNKNVRLMAHRDNGHLSGKLVVVEKNVPTERVWNELDEALRKSSRP